MRFHQLRLSASLISFAYQLRLSASLISFAHQLRSSAKLKLSYSLWLIVTVYDLKFSFKLC